jgi:hypothetical protein
MPTDKTMFLEFTHIGVIIALLQPQFLLAILYSLHKKHRNVLRGDDYADVNALPLKLLSMWISAKIGTSRFTLKGIRHT